MGARYKHDLQTGSTLVHHCGAGRAGLEPVERGREVLRLFGSDVRSFALLNEGPFLTYANQCQYGGEKADNPSPSEHRSVKWVGWRWEVGRAIVGWCLVALAFIGALVGVWSVVFWDWLGRWRWFVSSLGWIAFIGGLVQGLSLLTTF